MKFLLVGINAKYIHSNPAIRSIKAYAQKTGSIFGEIQTVEYTINQRKEDILADLYEQEPDWIGISCYIWNRQIVGEILSDLWKVLPNVPIWLGGPEVSYDAGEVLEQYPCVTGIMVGEGEATFSELAKAYEVWDMAGVAQDEKSGQVPKSNCIPKADHMPKTGQMPKLSDIPGLAYCMGPDRQVIFTGKRELLSLDEIPFLYLSESGDDSGYDLKDYENRIIYYETSRGCPFRCSYCLSSAEEPVRLRSIEPVKEELQFFLDRRVKQVKFVDRTFNCNEEHALAIWQYIKEHDNGCTNFHFEVEADRLTKRQLDMVSDMRPGLIQMEIGVQSANSETLKSVHRNPDLTYLAEMVRIISGFGNIHIHLDLIAGLPKEDMKSFERSFNTVYSMRPNQLQLGFLKALRGTEIRRTGDSYGLKYEENAPYEVLSTELLSYREILELKRIEEMVELYYNSNQFRTTLPLLEQLWESPFELFRKLAQYYQEKGYLIQTPSRSYRYRVLLDFAILMDPDREEEYRNSLMIDLYLREKLKSRPDFAQDLTPYKEKIKEIYRSQLIRDKYLAKYEGYDEKQLRNMTHLEPFDGEWLLFDYQKRDPLSGDAACYRLNGVY